MDSEAWEAAQAACSRPQPLIFQQDTLAIKGTRWVPNVPQVAIAGAEKKALWWILLSDLRFESSSVAVLDN